MIFGQTNYLVLVIYVVACISLIQVQDSINFCMIVLLTIITKKRSIAKPNCIINYIMPMQNPI